MPFNPEDYEIIEPYKGSGKHVNLAYMNPQFMARFQDMAEAYFQQTGKKLNIDDAWRSMQTQAQAYASGKPGVARPGVSLHPQGLAMDLNQAQAEDLARRHLLQDYGFYRPMRGEPWHIQMADFERRAPKVAATMKKKKFNPDDWEVVEEQPIAPADFFFTQEIKQQPQPSLPWQIVKGVGGAALTALDVPMKPVRAGIHAIESLGGSEQKIPGREQAQAMLQQINAARAKSGKPPILAPKTGVYAATPNSPELYNLAAELSLMGPAYKAAGALIKSARGLPGVRGIPFIGKKAAQAAEVAPTGTTMGQSSLDIEAAIDEQFGIGSKTAVAAETLPPTGAPSPLTPEKVQNIVQSVSEKMGTGNPGVNQIIKQIQKLKELPPWQRYGVQ